MESITPYISHINIANPNYKSYIQTSKAQIKQQRLLTKFITHSIMN